MKDKILLILQFLFSLCVAIWWITYVSLGLIPALHYTVLGVELFCVLAAWIVFMANYFQN